MNYLLIPSAVMAPREIGNLYDVPMALYPINGEPIINLILKQYPDDWSPVISGYQNFDLLKRNLNSNKKCELVKIDMLKDIGFTIFNTLDKIGLKDDDRVIINFADTVIDNNDLTRNCIVCKTCDDINKKWTYLLTSNGKITGIIDKTSLKDCVNEEKKLVCGVFTIEKPQIFLNFLRSEENEKGCNFYKALKKYSQIYPFDFIEAKNWLDIGHPDEYFDSKIAIKCRQFNHISFDKNRGIIIKTSDDCNKLISEIKWFLKLPNNLAYSIPRVFDYSIEPDNPYVKLEYCQYSTLLELFLYGNLDETSWIKIFKQIDFVLKDYAQYKMKDSGIIESLKDVYVKKTISRISKMKSNPYFSVYFDRPLTINGKKYKNLNQIIDIIPKIVDDYLLNISEFSVIHGDLCFSNILIDEKLNFIKLIDPRGSFGSFGICGDQRYEFAKLFHSIDGKYDYIIKDLFSLKAKGTTIDYKFAKQKYDLYAIAKDVFAFEDDNKIREIEIIEAFLFLSMIPLHQESLNHQIMMLAIGIEILNRWVDLKEY